MQSPSLDAYADFETKILPISQSSWQTPLITNMISRRNFSITTTTSIFDSALELEKSRGCRRLQIFARNTECCQSEGASLVSCKKLHRNRAKRSAIRGRDQRFASVKPRSTS